MLNRAQADEQATTFPAAVTWRAAGQSTAVVQPAVTQPAELTLSGVAPEVVLIHIGRFDPSTMDTS